MRRSEADANSTPYDCIMVVRKYWWYLKPAQGNRSTHNEIRKNYVALSECGEAKESRGDLSHLFGVPEEMIVGWDPRLCQQGVGCTREHDELWGI